MPSSRSIGSVPDQRVFGKYGPGPACDVLSELLEGSGYNVLMIGGRDTSAPLKIILSVRSAAGAQTAGNRTNYSAPVSEPPLPDPLPDQSSETASSQQSQNPFAAGEHPTDPAKFMEEILQRQHKIDEQAQQDQQNPPQQ